MSDADISQLGRYRILAELGRGAMGVVYRAEDPVLKRIVAIKTILMSPDDEERDEYEARFYQEARAAGGLNHPNIITIYDIGREGNVAYMAMELIEGIELRALMGRGRLPLALALDIAAQVADGLAFAHERGIVHRDVKPANVMIVRDRQAKIMDFGIARMQVSDIRTQTGMLLGSPKYMSPEQIAGERVDHRSDLFSLGVIVYELASGQAPFAAPTTGSLMHSIAGASAAPPSTVDASLPAMLDHIAARALEKERDARYQSAAEFAADLRECLEQTRPDAAGAAAGSVDVELTFSGGTDKTVKDAAPARESTRTVAVTATVAGEATQVAGRSAEPPARGAPFAGTAGRMNPLYASRAFDSSEALQNLETMAATGVRDAATERAGGLASALRRVWGDPDRRVFALLLVLATAGAVAIALL